jgi:hypothetical protein
VFPVSNGPKAAHASPHHSGGEMLAEVRTVLAERGWDSSPRADRCCLGSRPIQEDVADSVVAPSERGRDTIFLVAAMEVVARQPSSLANLTEHSGENDHLFRWKATTHSGGKRPRSVAPLSTGSAWVDGHHLLKGEGYAGAAGREVCSAKRGALIIHVWAFGRL